MYVDDDECRSLLTKILSWLKEDGVLFFRESCFHQSGKNSLMFWSLYELVILITQVYLSWVRVYHLYKVWLLYIRLYSKKSLNLFADLRSYFDNFFLSLEIN